jgi:hypothetical protein
LSISYGLTSSNPSEKESSCKTFIGLGEGTMIALLISSAISLAALQATIAAPTDAFRSCLRDAATKAKTEKVPGDGIEAYLKNACTPQMGTLKQALIAFRMKNGMTRKAAADDADMTVDDYVSTPADNYKFMANMNAPKPTAPAVTTAAPIVTPAAAPTTPATQPPKH